MVNWTIESEKSFFKREFVFKLCAAFVFKITYWLLIEITFIFHIFIFMQYFSEQKPSGVLVRATDCKSRFRFPPGQNSLKQFIPLRSIKLGTKHQGSRIRTTTWPRLIPVAPLGQETCKWGWALSTHVLLGS